MPVSPSHSLYERNRRKSSLDEPRWDEPERRNTYAKTFLRLLFSFIGLFILLSGYIAFGAYYFVWLESPLEQDRFLEMKSKSKGLENDLKFVASYLTDLHYDRLKSLDNCSSYIHSSLFWEPKGRYSNSECYSSSLSDSNIGSDLFCKCVFAYKKEYGRKAENFIKQVTTVLLNIIKENRYLVDEKDNLMWNWEWTYANSLLFTMTSLTLIGYGNIAPSTEENQLIFIIYVLFGLPIMMLFLAKIGGTLCDELKEIEDSQIIVPIVILLLIMALYVVAGAGVYSYWEEWALLDATYFSFITLTTIGFGDYVPGKSFLSNDSELSKIARISFTAFYCLIGLALISMGISLMQQHIVNKTRWAASQLGINGEENDNIDKIILTKFYGVKETPGVNIESLKEKELRQTKSSSFEFDGLHFDDL